MLQFRRSRWGSWVLFWLLIGVFSAGLAHGVAWAGVGSLLPRDVGILQTSETTLSLPEVTVQPGEQKTLSLTLNMDQGSVYGADIQITYDPAVASAISVNTGDLVSDWMLASNLETPGLILVGLAGSRPVTTGGELLRLVFQAVGGDGSSTSLMLTQGDLNEGSIPTTLRHGRLTVARYTPTPTNTPTPTGMPTNTPTPTNPPAPTLVSVGIAGPTTGVVQAGYIFTATVSPITATLPITYSWQATRQLLVTHAGGLSDTVTFAWSTLGPQAITVTATNVGSTVTDTHVITISHRIYLPLVLRNQ